MKSTETIRISADAQNRDIRKGAREVEEKKREARQLEEHREKDKKEMNRHHETREEIVTYVMRSPEAGRRAGQKNVFKEGMDQRILMRQKLCMYKFRMQSDPHRISHRVLTSGETTACLVSHDAEGRA